MAAACIGPLLVASKPVRFCGTGKLHAAANPTWPDSVHRRPKALPACANARKCQKPARWENRGVCRRGRNTRVGPRA